MESEFKQILTSSSSVEQLLDKKDIEKWRVPIDDLTFGQELGRGAFGLVLYAKLRQRSTGQHQQSDTDSGNDSVTYVSQSAEAAVGDKSSDVLEVAVKKLPADAGQQSFHELFKELDLMFKVGRHLNIVNLIGMLNLVSFPGLGDNFFLKLKNKESRHERQ